MSKTQSINQVMSSWNKNPKCQNWKKEKKKKIILRYVELFSAWKPNCFLFSPFKKNIFREVDRAVR